MKSNNVPPTQLGMLFDLMIGSGLGVLVFVNTNEPFWFSLAGIGLMFGLMFGAGVERSRGAGPK